jgi:hypothetical protein
LLTGGFGAVDSGGNFAQKKTVLEKGFSQKSALLDFFPGKFWAILFAKNPDSLTISPLQERQHDG